MATEKVASGSYLAPPPPPPPASPVSDPQRYLCACLSSKTTRLLGIIALCIAVFASARQTTEIRPVAIWQALRTQKFGFSPQVWPGAPADTDEEVAICVASKDLPLDEWLIHHYHHLGIRRFYIMDDRSDPPYESREEWPIPRSALTIRWHGPNDENDQKRLYEECFRSFGHLHKWIAVLDNDEFIEIVQEPGKSLAEFMRDYEDDCAEVGVNWYLYTSQGYLTKQPDLRHHYTECTQDWRNDTNGNFTLEHTTPNAFMKSITQTRYFGSSRDPHTMTLIENSPLPLCDEWKKQTFGAGQGARLPSHDKIAVHHYFSKSKEEFAVKIELGGGDGVHKDWESWRLHEILPKQTCSSLTHYHP